METNWLKDSTTPTAIAIEVEIPCVVAVVLRLQKSRNWNEKRGCEP